MTRGATLWARRRPHGPASADDRPDCTLGVVVLALLFVHDRGDVWLLYLVASLYGVGGSVSGPARSALLRVMVPEESLACVVLGSGLYLVARRDAATREPAPAPAG